MQTTAPSSAEARAPVSRESFNDTAHTGFIDLASFSSRKAASLFRSHLDENGIGTGSYDERDLQLFVFLTKPGASIKLQVSECDYARAATLLIEFEKEHPEFARFIFSCPECGSFAVEQPQFTRKFFTVVLVEWFVSIGLFPKQCYCRKCHHTWTRKRTGGVNVLHLHPPRSVFVPPPA